MNQDDKILKSTLNYIESIKDVTNKNLMAAVSEGKIKLDQGALSQVISLFNYSVDEGYHRGQNSLLREINGIFSTSETSSSVKTLGAKKN